MFCCHHSEPFESKVDSSHDHVTLFQNVKVFDGKSDALAEDLEVLVEGNFIKAVGPKLEAGEGARIIDGGGRTLLPGFMTMHEHIISCESFDDMLIRPYWDEIGAKMVVRAQDLFSMGFTTVRDGGAWCLGLKRAIDDGTVVGPRILCPGAALTQTGGHGDFRLPYQNNPFFSPSSQNPEHSMLQFLGAVVRADGVAEVRRAARANLSAGAHFIKVLGGGGVASPFDPLSSFQYSEEELKAAVEEATNFGTYATIHVHLDAAVNRAVDAGFKMVEHATVLKEDTLKRFADEGITWSAQCALFLSDPATSPAYSNDTQRAKAQIVYDGMMQTTEWAKKYGVKTLWGTDLIGTRKAYLELFPTEWTLRDKVFSPAEQLQQATKNGGEAVALSGIKNPYPDGPLGVIEPGAYADILLVDGNPLKDISILTRYEETINLIMKDGKVYKDCLEGGHHNV